MTINVHDVAKLCSPLTLSAYKEGTQVFLGNKVLNPSHGLK